MIDPIEDAQWILNESLPKNKIHNSSCRSNGSNYTNLSISNDNKITFSNIFSLRLKSVSRIIASELERILYTCVLIRVVFWNYSRENSGFGISQWLDGRKHGISQDPGELKRIQDYRQELWTG